MERVYLRESSGGLLLGDEFGSDAEFQHQTVGGHCQQMPAGGARARAAAGVGQEVELKMKRPPKINGV